MTLKITHNASTHHVDNTVDAIIVQEHVATHIWCHGNNSRLTIHIEPHAQAFLYCLNNVDVAEHQVDIHVGKDATISLFEFGLGHECTKRRTAISLKHRGATAHYFALDALMSTAVKHSDLTIFHQSPHTHSTQAFRGLYTDKASAHFLGKVVIEQCAEQSTAHQLYRSIILSDDAQASVMPHLEIYNHDIKASHGATIGELDYETLFYLCSRGIPEKTAKGLLLHTMVNDIVDNIKNPGLQEKLMALCADSIENMVGQ